MPNSNNRDRDKADLDRLIEEITVDAYGDDEQLWAFRQVIEDEVDFPADAFIIEEPVKVIKIDYDGNQRRGLTATFRGKNGSRHVVSAADVVFAPTSVAGRYLAAYRKWLGIAPKRSTAATSNRKRTSVRSK